MWSQNDGLLLAMEGISSHVATGRSLADCPQGDDNSPASFERILSNLSTKISKTSSRLDSLRQRSRRLKVLWTLYAGFAYLLCTIILTLVVGWKQWGPIEYTAVAGGPLMYITRELLMNLCA